MTTLAVGFRAHLLLGDKESDARILPSRHTATRHTFQPELVDNPSVPIGRVVDVDLVGHDSNCLGLIFGVLNCPACS